MKPTSAACLTALVFVWPLPLTADDGVNPSAVESAVPAEGRGVRVRELLLRALALTGIRYRWGGESPETGFDCSGLVMYLFNEALSRALPRTAFEMSRVGRKIARDELEPGDLVFFNTLRRPFSHVGIYLGDQRFIHAPARGGHVEVVNMTNHYWQGRYNGARRIEL
ncbi:MAG: C40 family peptidase [Betaproteobacteria bacterium]|nr:C40 family peptidase [Betaproteobacteria bacterium]